MNKVALFMSGLIIAGAAAAHDAKLVSHQTALTGLNAGEGRVIKATEYVNEQFSSGSFICAKGGEPIYLQKYFSGKSQIPFHEDHLVKFSICQDETLAECQEFATDKYMAFRALDGYLAVDAAESSVDLSVVKEAFKPCTPPDLDEKVKHSIHISDRQFAHVG